MLSLSEVRIQLFQNLEAYFEHKKYVGLPPNLLFTRTTRFGKSSIQISVTEGVDGFRCDMFCGLRHDIIENWLANYQLPSAHFSNSSHTLMVNSDQLTNGFPFKAWPIKNMLELSALSEQMIEFLDATGFRFLDKFKNLAKLDRLFNEHHALAARLNNYNYQFAFRAMALAKISRRADYERLYQAHSQYLITRGFSGIILANFEATFARLNELSLN